MLYNYFKVALRSFRRNRFFSSINLIGLTLSLAATLLMFLYTSHELSYDKFHDNYQQIYQVKGKINYGGREMQFSALSAPFGPRLVEEDIRVTDAVRLHRPGKTIVKSETEESYFVENIVFTDPSFVEMFDFEWIIGNPSGLAEPGQVYITPTMAQQYFGSEDAVGKVLYYDREYPLLVAGIVEEAPSNSSLRYDMLVSFATIGTIDDLKDRLENENISLGSFETYLLLDDPSSKVAVEETISKLAIQSADETYMLEPLKDVYMGGMDLFTPKRIYMFALLFVGILILVLALLNYINLTVARSMSRTKEVGIRKVNGASKSSLVFQFFLDSFIIVSLAFLLALVLLVYLRPQLASFLDQPLDPAYLQNPVFIGIVITAFIGSVLIAGAYPAYVMSRFNPISIIKGNGTGSGKNSFTQKMFTTFQFMVSIALLLATLVIIDQLKFLKTQEIGLTKDQILAINLSPNEEAVGFEYMKNEIRRQPDVVDVAVSSLSLFKGGYSIYFTNVPGTDEQLSLSHMNVDDHFIDLMDIEYLTRYDEIPLKGNLIANQSAAERLKMTEDSVATEISLGISTGTIAGVTHDFNYTSLKSKVEPMVMSVLDDTTRSMITYGGAMYVKLAKGVDPKKAMASVQTEVEKFQPDAPFEYYFLDEAFNNLYKSEERMATLLSGFTFLAILIAGMGLLGMITFTLERRVREFGIRKVLGASGARITWMVIGEYLLIFVISALIAVPLAWWAMSEWLTSFSYRIDVGMIHPLLAVSITLLVGISTIALRTWHASKANPADSLRVEA